MCYLEGRIYLFGGRYFDGVYGRPIANMFVVDLEDESHSRQILGFEADCWPRGRHRPVMVGSSKRQQLFLIGGNEFHFVDYGPSGDVTTSGSFFRFDLRSEEWEVLPEPPFDLSESENPVTQLIKDDDFLVVCFKKSVAVFDIEALSWELLYTHDEEALLNKAQPIATEYPIGWVSEDRFIYMLGGTFYAFANQERYTDPRQLPPWHHLSLFGVLRPLVDEEISYTPFWRFDMESREWQEVIALGHIPSGRAEVRCCVMRGGSRVVFFGGYAIETDFDYHSAFAKRNDTIIGANKFLYLDDMFEFRSMPELQGTELCGMNRRFPIGGIFRQLKDDLPSPHVWMGRAQAFLFKHNGEFRLWGGYTGPISSYQDKSWINCWHSIHRLVLTDPEQLKMPCSFCFETRRSRGGGRCPCGARYCSRDCQTRDWKWHRVVCRHHRRQKKRRRRRK